MSIIIPPSPQQFLIEKKPVVITGQLAFKDKEDDKPDQDITFDIYPLPLTGQTMTNQALVLDLDETCVHSFLDMNEYKNLKISSLPDLRARTYVISLVDVVTPRGQGEITNIWGIKRPHLDEFLIFCFSYFKIIIIWSAGKYKYVHEIVNNIFGQIIPPHAVLTWNDCHKTKDQCDKILSVLYDHPELGRYVKPENTLVVDDRIFSFRFNPQNGVLIPAYKPEPKLDQLRADDIALLQLKAWLLNKDVMNSRDVRTLDKENIFNRSMSQLTSTPLSPIN